MATIVVQTDVDTPLPCEYYNNNAYTPSGFGIPNCTCYAAARASFLLYNQDVSYIRDGWMTIHPEIRPLCGNGVDFIARAAKLDDYKNYVSQTPRLGSLIGYDNGGAGHVSVVEGIIDRDTIIVSSSGYGVRGEARSKYIWVATLTRSNGFRENWMSNSYKFIGFYDIFRGRTPYTDYTMHGTPHPAPIFPIYPGGNIDAGIFNIRAVTIVNNYKRLKRKKNFPKVNYFRR